MHDWEYVVAAGDSPVDAAMARDANLFFVVAGQGDFLSRLSGVDGSNLGDSKRELRTQFAGPRTIVHVPRQVSFDVAVRAGPEAVGISVKPVALLSSEFECERKTFSSSGWSCSNCYDRFGNRSSDEGADPLTGRA